MKWLIWSPAIAIVVAAFAVPGGLLLFGLPLLALGYLVFGLIALGESGEHRPDARARALHEQREPASQTPTAEGPIREPPATSPAPFVVGASGLEDTTTRRRAA